MESQSSSDAGAARDPSLRRCHNCLHLCLPGQDRCPECGAFQRHADEARPSPGVAGVLSFLIPGLGHFYLARPISGVVWLFAAAIVWFWASGSVRSTPFFLPSLEYESWRDLGFRGAVLLYHALAAVHAIHQGQPSRDTQRGRTARVWLLRLGLASIAALFILTYGLPRARRVLRQMAPSAQTTAAPQASPPVAKAPALSIQVESVLAALEGGVDVGLSVTNQTGWLIERATLELKTGSDAPSGSAPISYVNPNGRATVSIHLDTPPEWLPTGFTLEAKDVQTLDGSKECQVHGGTGLVLLRLQAAEVLSDGRSLLSFQCFNLCAEPIPAGSWCHARPVARGSRSGSADQFLVFPEILPGSMGTTKLVCDQAVTDFELGSNFITYPQGGQLRATLLKFGAVSAEPSSGKTSIPQRPPSPAR